MDIVSLVSKLDSSDWIAIIALGVSAVVGIVNYRYTRRAFTAAYLPRVRFSPRIKPCGGGNCLGLKVKNLSNEYSMTNISLEIIIRSPRNFLPFSQNNKHLFSKKIESLLPQQELFLDHIPGQYTNLEEFFIKEFPKWVLYGSVTAPRDIYHLSRDGKAAMQVNLSYESGVTGADRVRIRKKYLLVPKSNQEVPGLQQILSWGILERDSKG